MLHLTRHGQTGKDSFGLTDSLTFKLNGNQVVSANDDTTLSTNEVDLGFTDSIGQDEEYRYNANGNLIQDLSKKVIDIQYNSLNLPYLITFDNGNTIAYTYNANGKKLRTVHKAGIQTTTTDYCGNAIYENGVAKLLLTEAGYISMKDKKHHFFLKDHQGNIRVVADEEGNVEETNHYYPFGETFTTTSSLQPYKYNGKELDTEYGLNWYDYGARMYDVLSGRWNAGDPSSEKYYNWSPYVYCKNNPVLRIDLDGKDNSK